MDSVANIGTVVQPSRHSSPSRSDETTTLILVALASMLYISEVMWAKVALQAPLNLIEAHIRK